jgi:hypothetical protein
MNGLNNSNYPILLGTYKPSTVVVLLQHKKNLAEDSCLRNTRAFKRKVQFFLMNILANISVL